MPINLPNGSNVEDIVLPDGSNASEVIAPDGSTLWERNAIPDGSVKRPADDSTGSASSGERGILIKTGDYEREELDFRISDNTTGAETAYLRDQDNDGDLIADKDVSGLSAGDIFTITAQIPANTEISITADWNFDEGDYGYVDLSDYPYTDDPTDIEIINGFSGGSTNSNAYFVDEVGVL